MCTFTPGLKQEVKFLKVMTGDENGDDSVSVTKVYANIQAKPPLGCFSEQLLKIPKLKMDTLRNHLTLLRPRGQVDQRYSQIV